MFSSCLSSISHVLDDSQEVYLGIKSKITQKTCGGVILSVERAEKNDIELDASDKQM